MFIKKWILLLGLILILACFLYFRLYEYLSFESLRANRQQLLQWTNDHYLFAVCIYIFLYAIAVAASIPGAVFFTLAGGFLFGIWLGTLYVVFSATLGATILFLAIKLALADWVKHKAGKRVQQMQVGLQENAFYYLLILRLIPLFPFWLVNVVPALLDIPLTTFISATLIGIIPGSFIYTYVGYGLGTVFDANQEPHLNIIFQPNIFLPLLGLAILSILPVVYKHYKRRAK